MLVEAGKGGLDPPFAYTVGLQETFDWPELLCYGLPLDTMAALLNGAVDELRSREAAPTNGLALHDVVEGFQCGLAPVAPRHHKEHLGFAIWFARYKERDPDSLICMQLLWPDRNGKLPGDPGCSPDVKRLQPLLAT